MRLFFALPLPPDALAAAAAAQARLRQAAGSGARLSFPAAGQLHVTLAFLGEVPDSDAQLAAAAGRAAWEDAQAFEISLDGSGAFPGVRRPRALWLGIGAGAAELSALAARLRTALSSRGLPLDERSFRAHLTVARVKPGGTSDALRALAAAPRGEIARFRAGLLALVRSELHSGGSLHHPVEEFVLRD